MGIASDGTDGGRVAVYGAMGKVRRKKRKERKKGKTGANLNGGTQQGGVQRSRLQVRCPSLFFVSTHGGT